MEEKFDEFKKYLFVIVKAILCVLNKFILGIHQQHFQRPLCRQLMTPSKYEYTMRFSLITKDLKGAGFSIP